ncbi:hypothetical protein MTO96_029346 [Rhipicephalus appendiculatus]
MADHQNIWMLEQRVPHTFEQMRKVRQKVELAGRVDGMLATADSLMPLSPRDTKHCARTPCHSPVAGHSQQQTHSPARSPSITESPSPTRVSTPDPFQTPRARPYQRETGCSSTPPVGQHASASVNELQCGRDGDSPCPTLRETFGLVKRLYTSYFSLKGGSDSKDAVRRALRHIISKGVAVQCSWAGSSGNKSPFKSLSNVLLLLLDFVRTATYTDAQTGKVIEVPLERVRLKETAVPSVFANCPKYMSRPTPSAREAPEEKKVRLEAASLRAAIELSVAAQEEENRKNKVGSFEEFCRALSNFSVSDFWSVIIKESKVVFLDLALQRAPAVRSSVAVSVDLCIDVFIGEARIENLPSVNVPSHLQDLRQLNEVLQSVEQLHVSHSSDDNQKAHRLLKIVLMLLEDVCSEYQLQEFHGWHLEVLKFVIPHRK